MSNDLAIATVTTTLRYLLQTAVARDSLGAAEISTERPDLVKPNDGDVRINLYLYQALPNTYWRNADLPTRAASGSALRRPQTALDLHYLISFYGSERRLYPQRLLGRAVSALHAQPVLSADQIAGAVEAATKNRDDTYLAGSDLGQQVDRVTLSPLPLSLEELAKLWSVFFQTPYVLSVAYSASAVLIEAPLPVRSAAPPVRAVRIYSRAARPPLVDSVEPAGDAAAIGPGAGLVIRGVGLAAERVRLRIDATLLDVAPAGDTQIDLATLPPDLSAGVHGLSVLHLLARGDGPPLPAAESNLVAFVLRPRINAVRYMAPRDHDSQPETPMTPPAIVLGVSPPIAAGQRVSLLLARVGDGPSYTVEAPQALEGAALGLPIGDVAPGEYSVRLRVDGAESLPERAPDGGLSGPRLVVPAGPEGGAP